MLFHHLIYILLIILTKLKSIPNTDTIALTGHQTLYKTTDLYKPRHQLYPVTLRVMTCQELPSPPLSPPQTAGVGGDDRWHIIPVTGHVALSPVSTLRQHLPHVTPSPGVLPQQGQPHIYQPSTWEHNLNPYQRLSVTSDPESVISQELPRQYTQWLTHWGVWKELIMERWQCLSVADQGPLTGVDFLGQWMAVEPKFPTETITIHTNAAPETLVINTAHLWC